MFVNMTVHIIPKARRHTMITETGLHQESGAQRVATAPTSTNANQPKRPTYMTTRMGMGKQSSMFVNVGAAAEVAKKMLVAATA
jgi:hypothetical protein